MTALCPGNGPSQMIPGNTNVVVWGAGAIASYLNNKGAVWAYAVAPLLGVISFNLPTYCATDPPALPAVDANRVLNWFNPLSTDGAADLRVAMTQLLQALVWYDLCECTNGGTPAAPNPAASIPNVAINQPITGPAGSLPCWDVNATAQAAGIAIIHFPGRVTPGGINTVNWLKSTNIQCDMSVGNDGTANSVNMTVIMHETNNVTTTILNNHQIAVGGSYSFTYTLPADADYFEATFQGTVAGQNNTVTLRNRVWCSGTNPSQPQSNCCPPDPILQGMVQQILQYVSLMQRQIVPFAYVPGTVHHALQGSGELVVQGLLGLKIAPSALPSVYGRQAGDPDELWLSSWITWGNADGWVKREPLTHSPYLSFPSLAGQFTKIGYTFAPGMVADVTELVREA